MAVRRLALGAAAVAGLAAAVALLSHGRERAPNSMVEQTPAVAAVVDRDAAASPAVVATAVRRVDAGVDSIGERVMREGSLRDSAPDGRVTVADGRVRPDVDLRRLFDYYLTTIGELDPAQIRALLLDRLRGAYSDAIVQQVLDLFDRYVAYERALAGLDPGAIASPRERVGKVLALRRRMLGDELAQALFGDDALFAEVSAARIEVAGDSTLSAEQKAQALAALDAQLPPERRAQREDAETAALARAQERQLESSGADAAGRYADRAAVWGPEAAQRLAELDAQRARWDARVQSFEQARATLLSDAARNAAERDAAVRALLERSFDAPEQRRVLALEEIAAK